MSVSFSSSTEKNGQDASQIRGRLEPCLSLENGETAFPLTRIDPLYDELPMSFGRVNRTSAWPNATQWSRAAFLRLTTLLRDLEITIRPIHLPLPLSILTENGASDIMAKTCIEEGYCPQEFMLEIQDASLACGTTAHFDHLDAFRRHGFRIALDARRSAETAFSKRLRGAIERLRVTADDLLRDEMLQLRADMVSCIGGDVILDRANWRDVNDLQRFGATHSARLLTDA